jgi:hypothetical protein
MSTESKQEPKRLHPWCKTCGWRKGGVDSWNGRACKCGHSEPPLPNEPASIAHIGERTALSRARGEQEKQG